MVTVSAWEVSRRRPVAHFVHDEICVVVSLPRAMPTEGTHDAVYHAVREYLNREIARALPAPHGAARITERDQTVRVVETDEQGAITRDVTVTHITRDLTPTPALWGRCRSDAELFLPLDRPGGSAKQYALLDRADGRTTALHFYTLNVEADDDSFGDTERRQVVRELVKLINHRIGRRARGRHPDGAWQIVAATPNWLAGIAGDPDDGGTPGTPPEPVEESKSDPPANWTFRFGVDTTASLAQGSDTAGKMVVAVLDTCPTQAQVSDAADRFPANDLLQRVAGRVAGVAGVTIDGALVLSPTETLQLGADDFAHLAGFALRWTGRGPTTPLNPANNPEHYRMADHGLFVAGIIKDIAPAAEVHLYRVLDDTGVGDLSTLAHTLVALPIHYRDHLAAGGRVIVNLSLTVHVPTGDHLPHQWLPHLTRNPVLALERLPDICATLQQIHFSLSELMDWLREKGILIVAAAGNEGDGDAFRPEPGLPARYDTVLGVAAVNSAGAPAFFSSQGDEARFGNGVATYGGDATPQADGSRAIARPDGVPDAVRGIFSAPVLPLGKGPNETGWVYWAGTSFAAPIIAGLAANHWMRHPAAQPDGVVAYVYDQATVPETALECPAVMVAQVPV